MTDGIVESHTVMVWPEPLVIELVSIHLDRHSLGHQQRTILARRHAGALRALVQEADGGWCALRSELDRTYAALGVTPREVATIDRAVFAELTRLIADRHRLSPRRRRDAGLALHAALGRLLDAMSRATGGSVFAT